MNLLLLEDADFVGVDRVRLTGRRLKHLHEVHRAEAGDRLRVGRLGGMMGEGRLLALDAGQAELQVSLDQPPPAKLPLTLILALPRPKMLKRVLQTVRYSASNSLLQYLLSILFFQYIIAPSYIPDISGK